MKHFKYISLNICFALILTLIIFFLINSGLIRNIVGGPHTEPFPDLIFNYIQWLECYRSELSDEVCKFWPMNYGMIFLKTPFNQTLKFFYINYLPYITILLFVFTVTFLLNPKNKLEYFIIILAILNPSTLVLIDRFNFDIFIFLMLIIVALNRVYIFNWIIFLYCFLVKLYPIVSGIFIFIENKKRSFNFLLVLIISFVVIASYFIFIDVDKYSSISENYFPVGDVYVAGGKAGYWHIFSLNTIPKILKYLGLNYIFSLVLVYSIFFYVLYKLCRSSRITNIINDQDFFTYRWRLFLLGGNILFITYMAYSNWTQREVFLILLIPQFLFLSFKENKLSNLVIYFLILRYLFLFIYGPSNIDSTYHIDGRRYFNQVFLITTSVKGLLDFILISLVGSIVIKANFLILKRFLLKFRY